MIWILKADLNQDINGDSLLVDALMEHLEAPVNGDNFQGSTPFKGFGKLTRM